LELREVLGDGGGVRGLVQGLDEEVDFGVEQGDLVAGETVDAGEVAFV
jgi:hypothetical protein